MGEINDLVLCERTCYDSKKMQHYKKGYMYPMPDDAGLQKHFKFDKKIAVSVPKKAGGGA